jgi:stress-induced morphogen
LKNLINLISEEFTTTYFADEIIHEAGVCNECLQKCNDFDEYTLAAQTIQQEITAMFEKSTLKVDDQTNPEMEEQMLEAETLDVVSADDRRSLSFKAEQEEEIIDDAYSDAVVYEQVVEEGVNDELYLAHSLEEIEEDYLENEKLPRAFQNVELKQQKVIKSRVLRSDKDEDIRVVELIENGIKLYQCEICSRTFKERSKLKSHRQIHTDIRNISCPLCDKKFKTQACLRSHKRVHNPVFIYCAHCNKRYTQKAELAKHIKFVHFNRRDYICDICSAAFGCKGHLKVHYLTHQQFKGVSCEVNLFLLL